MKYLDTGARDPDQCLATWLNSVFTEDLLEIRFQSGFFSANALGILLPVLERSRTEDRLLRILVGSNDGSTTRDDMAALSNLIGFPRKNAALGIIRFANSYFHPKTYHFRRHDGTETAFVGSANLTLNGLSLHVEAGIALDSREGDAANQLSMITNAIDQWFEKLPEGLVVVDEKTSLEDLVEKGILSLVPPPPPSTPSGATNATPSPIPRLKRLVAIPTFSSANVAAGGVLSSTPASSPAHAAIVLKPTASQPISVPKAGLKQYYLFDPSATAPMRDILYVDRRPVPQQAFFPSA